MSIAAVSIAKPEFIYDRDLEWAALTRFVTADGAGARLGLVYGRRRQGKTLLLDALSQAYDGFMWQARQQSAPQNLRHLAEAIGRFSGIVPRLDNWDDAIEALLGLRRPTVSDDRVLPVVIDEVGYVIDGDPGFASRLQAALAPASRRGRSVSIRIVLCGSAFGQMRSLADAGSALRGRSQLDLILRPFRFREAAGFWELDANPDVAFRLHALIGGTPAYREFVAGVGPRRGDLDSWAAQYLLSPSSPLFREGRVVVAEDPALPDRGLYWSVLGAIADGATGRGEITGALGRPATSLHHALATLVDAGWVRTEHDPLRRRGTRFLIDEPIVRFHRLVIEPAEARLSLRAAGAAVWDDALPLIRSRIYGPHLERLAREWLLADADEAVAGGRITACGPSSVGTGADRLALDLLAVETTARGAIDVCAIGEVKAEHDRMGLDQLARLDRAAAELPARKTDAAVKRILFSRSGFTRDLQLRARRRAEVELVDLHRLYSAAAS